MAADHEGFADEDAGAIADGEEGLGLGEGHAERFFAEDVLAGFGGADGPGDVELVGKRIVDGVDAGVGEEFFVGAVGGGDVELGGDGAGFGQVAGGDGGDCGKLAALHGGDDFSDADAGSGENAPADFFVHGNRVQGAGYRVQRREGRSQRKVCLTASRNSSGGR